MCIPVCMQIVHVQKCSYLNKDEQYVVRGSIGLADWICSGAGTPLTQGQDIPLTGARRERGRGRETSESETERREDTEEALHCFFFLSPFPHFPPWKVVKGQNKEGDAK